jgi:hypothetical protein
VTWVVVASQNPKTRERSKKIETKIPILLLNILYFRPNSAKLNATTTQSHTQPPRNTLFGKVHLGFVGRRFYGVFAGGV